MVIQHNISAVNAYRNLNNNTTALNKNLEKLSSGYRINRAADDAAGLAISESMRSKIAGLDQSVNNANDGIGLIQTTEGALSETHSMLQRLTTLATQAANGTYNTVARSNIQSEVDELAQEISRIATSTSYNGIKMLTGSVSSISGDDTHVKLQIGPTSKETLTISASKMTASALGVSGLKMTNVTLANSAITKISNAINLVSKYRATLGAKQNRLEHTINNLKVTSENVTSAESRIRDTDMASEMAAYTKNNVLVQAATSMLAQANQSGSSVLSLLQ
jgi:flagellin